MSLDSAMWFLRSLLVDHLHLPLALLAVAGAIALSRRRDLLTRVPYPMLLLLGAVIAFTVLRNKDARYVLPAISAIAVIATAWLAVDVWWRRATVLLGVFAAVSFTATSFGMAFVPSLSIGSVPVFVQHGYIVGPPVREDLAYPHLGRDGRCGCWASLGSDPIRGSGFAVVQPVGGSLLTEATLPDGRLAWLDRHRLTRGRHVQAAMPRPEQRPDLILRAAG